jgi:hypothetical protein
MKARIELEIGWVCCDRREKEIEERSIEERGQVRVTLNLMVERP